MKLKKPSYRELTPILREEFTRALNDVITNFTYAQVGQRKVEVLGYLREHYPETYQIHIKQGIFERATFRLFKEYTPEIVSIIDINILEKRNFKPIPVQLFENYEFDAFPRREFDRMIIYAQGELMESIEPIPDYPFTLEGYPVKGLLAKADFILLGWALSDFPVVVIAYSPKIGKVIGSLSVQFENLKDEMIDVYRKIIGEYRAEDSVISSQLDQEKRRSLKWREMYEQSEGDFRNVLAHRQRLSDQMKQQGIVLKRTFYYLWIILTIVLIMILGFTLSSADPTTLTNSTMGG